MISDDVCCPLSLGEGWGEASLYAISVSAPLMSSSARSKVEGPAESFAKSLCEIPLFARDDTFVVFVFVIVFVLYAAQLARPSEPARAVSTAMRILRSLPKFICFIWVMGLMVNGYGSSGAALLALVYL